MSHHTSPVIAGNSRPISSIVVSNLLAVRSYAGMSGFDLRPIEASSNATMVSLDLSRHNTFTIKTVQLDEDKKLVRHESLPVHVVKSECDRYFVADFEDIEMELWGESMEELEDAFNAMLRMMWKRFIMDDSNNFTRGALEFRKRLDTTYKLVTTCL